MFPDNWDKNRLKFELDRAFKNGKRIDGTNYKWEGITPSGVKVHWFKNEAGEVTTIYPVL